MLIACGSFELRNMRVSVSDHPTAPDLAEIHVKVDVLDTSAVGASFEVWRVTYVAKGMLCPQKVRAAILETLEHELDECLHVNGQRVCEPHPELTFNNLLPDTKEAA